MMIRENKQNNASLLSLVIDDTGKDAHGLVVRKGAKVKILKVKQERFGSMTVKNTWGLDELKVLEDAGVTLLLTWTQRLNNI